MTVTNEIPTFCKIKRLNPLNLCDSIMLKNCSGCAETAPYTAPYFYCKSTLISS